MTDRDAGENLNEELVYTLAILAPGIISSIFVFIPIENYLSAYIVPSTFIWYRLWRAALIALLLWIVSGFIYSEKRYSWKMFFLGSAVTFMVFHYWFLWSINMVRPVRLYPLFYFVGDNSPYVLDMGQVVGLITLYAFRGEILGSLKNRR
jgi:hypothetical protein